METTVNKDTDQSNAETDTQISTTLEERNEEEVGSCTVNLTLQGEFMTQDCIEWDESKGNVDMRKLADPTFRTPRAAEDGDDSPAKQETIRSGSSCKLSSSFGARCLPLQAVTRVLPPLVAQPQPTNNTSQEIDRIFDKINNHNQTNENTVSLVYSKPVEQRSNVSTKNQTALDSCSSVLVVEGSRKRLLWEQKRQYNNRRRKPISKAKHDTQYISKSTKTTTQKGETNDFYEIMQRILSPTIAPATHYYNTTTSNDQILQLKSHQHYTRPNLSKNQSNDKPKIHIACTATSSHFVPRPRQSSTTMPASPSWTTSISNTTAATATRFQNSDTNKMDEFDDLDFSADDLKLVDSLLWKVACQQSHPEAMQAKENVLPHVDKISDSSLDEFKKQTKFESISDDENDPFGDITDIDFHAIEEAIAEQTQNTHVHHSGTVPPIHSIVSNPRNVASATDERDTSFVSFTRYKVLCINEDVRTCAKILTLAVWTSNMLKEEENASRALHQCRVDSAKLSAAPVAGVVYLRGEWYHTQVVTGDDIHICSLTGKFRTDKLPLMLHTCPPPGSDADDLVIIVHPDMLLTPTVISESINCTRRAILKSRLGSTGLSDRSALFGTMRHGLFEETMKKRDFSIASATKFVQKLVKDNAEGLLSCGVSSSEAADEVIKFLPQIQCFANEYTEFGNKSRNRNDGQAPLLESQGSAVPMGFLARNTEAIEEPVISPELGLKGNIDMMVEALTSTNDLSGRKPQTSNSLMSIELKTGHNQKPQNAHMAQLTFYVLMMQTRYGVRVPNSDSIGAAESGVLLYINNESIRALNISPMVSEIKSLIGQRNVVAIQQFRASRPRGITLSYEKEETPTGENDNVNLNGQPPPAELPELLPNSFSCKKCYSNRECMMYAAASRYSMKVERADPIHKELLSYFTGHLAEEEFTYFLHWDRLIDLEADAGNSMIAKKWLLESDERENESSQSVSALAFDPVDSSADAIFDESWYSTIAFRRNTNAHIQTPLSNVGFLPGCLVTVSSDTTTQSLSSSRATNPHTPVRPKFHIVRGVVHKVTRTQLQIRVSRDDLIRVQKIGSSATNVTFRLDRDDAATGISTLRQNLVNLFTGDSKSNGLPATRERQPRLAWLRDMLIRLRKPVFDRSLVKSMFTPPANTAVESIPGCDLMDLAFEFSELNPDQRAAAEKVIAANDYTMIQGLPGTGKTSVIAFVARLLVALGKRVLITSYTHAAVDNVLLKLIDSGVSVSDEKNPCPVLVRVGNRSSVHPGTRPILATAVAAEIDSLGGHNSGLTENIVPSAESLRRVVSFAKIVGVTALTIPRSPLLVGCHFDVVIVDEAGQISQPAVIGALMSADSFVLVGDHMQLPPLVTSELAAKGGFGVSMLMRLAEKHPDDVAQLTLQYRMHEDICRLSNDIIYKGKLNCANESVATQTMLLRRFPSGLPRGVDSSHWLYRTIDPCVPVVFLNTDKIKVMSPSQKTKANHFHALERVTGRRVGGSIVNETEARLVQDSVRALVGCGADCNMIGVICPFRAQIRILAELSMLSSLISAGLELSTIDRYQGRDKTAIVLSFVRSNEKGMVGRLLEDCRRLNVAVTRAKCKLIMIGSFSTLSSGSDVLRPVLCSLLSQGRVVDITELYGA